MALGYLSIGLLVGLLVATAALFSGAGILLALASLSLAGSAAMIAAMVASARCPETLARASRD